MGEHKQWAQPNGLLPDAGSLIRVLDSETWFKAEERTADLIACIQPNLPSEQRRIAVAGYVRRLIKKCFPCEVFPFGSVPLKTYLPDGDIDLTAFRNPNLKDTWANQVRDMLESEERSENAEFHVKDVQYIQADVKIIKCLVENIVVDISFNQLGGLSTLCFLERVDHLINQSHLVKRSIILIKAWCYYESRILGAHHGLISTYALETLVLYIFHVFNSSFTGPLEVLYRFLEFFSNFDWENFCVSLWGPVRICSLPDVTPEPPRKDIGELLPGKLFLEACSSAYAVLPGAQENHAQPFVSKHFNVIDPLRVNNNLGRSVSAGNFFRIKSAFSFGAKRLARLIDCPKGNLVYEVNQFFMNTWDRHGSGNRPDAPSLDLLPLKLSSSDDLRENPKNNTNAKRTSENTSVYETKVAHTRSRNSSQSTSTSEATLTQTQKRYNHLNNLRVSDKVVREVSPNPGTYIDKCQISARSDRFGSDMQGRFLFARTHSSPELTEAYSDASSQRRPNKLVEGGKFQATSRRQDNNRRMIPESDIVVNHSAHSMNNDPSSRSTSYHCGSGLGATGDEFSSASETRGIQQEEQDLVNMMESFTAHSLNGQVHLPPNFASSHLPLPISPAILASMGYAQRNLTGMLPPKIPMIDPSFLNMQFPRGLVSPPLTHYFPGIRLNSNSGDIIAPVNQQLGAEFNPEDADHDFWEEQDIDSTGDFEVDGGNYEMLQSEDKLHSDCMGFDFVTSSQRLSGSSRNDNRSDSSSYRDNRNDVYIDDSITSSRFSSSAHSSPLRSKTSSESSWDGSSANVSKSTREKQGKTTVSLSDPSTSYRKGENASEHDPQPVEDERDFYPLVTVGSGTAERSSHINGYKIAQTSGSDSMIPTAPVFLGHGLRQRVMDNSGAVPYTFYPTGPPVPFLMLPVYNAPSETETSNASSKSRFGGEDDMDRSTSGQTFDTSEELNATNPWRGVASVETLKKQNSDILNGDFASHLQNLQYGRFCQDPQYNGGPLVYPSPVAFPPVYMQGQYPWNGLGRPLSSNMNPFTQLMSYGPQLVPVTQPQSSVSNRLPDVYQHYVDEVPRHRSGTGTYLPNHKAPIRDGHLSGTRKGNYNSDRSDKHSDREGNWNINSKSRASGRSHGRSQTEKSNSRIDQSTASSYRHDSVPSYKSQKGPLRSNCDQNGPPTVAYGMYPLQAMNANGVSSNGANASSMVMLYPFEHNVSHGSHGEQLEFGSLGPVGLSRMNEQSQPSERSRSRRPFEEQRFHGGSTHWSSPDQPSSPHFQRSVAQRNYQLKDEDFPPLAFPNQGEHDSWERS